MTSPGRQVLWLILAILLTAAAAPGAEARSLTKRDARAGAVHFMDRIAWAFDVAQSGERVHVRPPRFCDRISHVTVKCPMTLWLPSSGTTLKGHLRVHRTSQGLLGYLLPWDPAHVRETLGRDAASA